jgi:uncharacterized protein (DUF58 family)
VHEPLGLVDQADESALDSPRRRRSEELLEARKYYPGDDVHKLNWKVFAHMDELFLRIGEEVPPPESRFLFVLDTTSNPLVPNVVASEYLDSMVQSCASMMVQLVGRGLEVTFSRPGERVCRSFGEGSRDALLVALAEAWWTTETWTPELPTRLLQAVIISSPGSPGLSRIVSELESRGWSFGIFLQDLAARAPVVQHRLRDLILLPRAASTAPRPAILRRRELSTFADALAREMSLHHGRAQRVGHAAES